MKKAVFLFSLFCLTRFLFSQQDSVANYTRLPHLFLNVKENHLGEDSVIDNHFNYLKFNYNGSIGLPSQEFLLENFSTADLGFRYMLPNYRNTLFTKDDVSFYTAKKPYTRAFALVGQRQEQVLRLIHTQNIKRFNYTLKFNRLKGNGFYVNQAAVTDNFASSINYTSKKSRYKVHSYLLFNKVRHKENGGIASDSLFEEGINDSKDLLEVNIGDPNRNAKRVTRTLDAGLTQQFRFNKSDSLKADHFLFHSFSYGGDFFVYDDDVPGIGFYSNVYLDSTKTYDSAHVQKFINSVGYNFQSKQAHRAAFYTQYRNEFARLCTYNFDSVLIGSHDSLFKNHIVSAGFSFQPRRNLLKLCGEYIVSGSNTGDMKAGLDYVSHAGFDLATKKSGKIIQKELIFKLSLSYEQRTPDFFLKRYLANNFQWTNDFDRISFFQFNSVIGLPKNRLGVDFDARFYNNYIFFGSDALPHQSGAGSVLGRVGLFGKVNLKKIYLKAKLNYQVTDNEFVFRIPQYVGQAQLYYEDKIFKKNLHWQVGVQATYYSSFSANAYMPATNMYYLQNTKTVGNYPFLDFYINCNIKPVRFFFKLEHINQGLMGSNYILTPTYPMPDRAFKFGFTWLFWD